MKHWIDPKISYRTFKQIMSHFPDSGPAPKSFDRQLWGLLKARKLNIFLDSKDREDPVKITQMNIKGGKVLEEDWSTKKDKRV